MLETFEDYDENLATPASVQVDEEDDCKILAKNFFNLNIYIYI